ncbi:putative membrane protein YedE/YeeE [Bradyrhizobium yuanmingense]
MESTQLVILAGLAIGLVYGAVGLLSGFCLMSSMRGLLAEGDGRLVRTYALAIAVAIAASQFLAGSGTVDLGKSIYLQQSFSPAVLFLGGLLFGYGMVLSNGCGSRALVLLGRGNLRSFVVVIVLAIAAQMTLKGLIAPARIALDGNASHGSCQFAAVVAGDARLHGIAFTRARRGRDNRRAEPVRFRASCVPSLARSGRSGHHCGPPRRRRLAGHRLSRCRRLQSGPRDLPYVRRADRR